MGEIADALRHAAREGARAPEPPDGDRRSVGLGAPARRRESGPEPLAWPANGAAAAKISAGRAPGWEARAVWAEHGGRFAESFRHLALRVRAELLRRETRTLLVTSALPGEGKTLTACNLALGLASVGGGERVALVDLDLRNPGVARSLGVRSEAGIEAALRGEAELGAVVLRTDVPALDLFPARRRVKHAHELLAAPRLGLILRELAERYGAVVCDSPPTLPVPDVELIAAHAGVCLPVVRAGWTPRAAFRELVEHLPGSKVIGVFLNHARLPRHERRYAYYHRDEADDEGPGSAG